MHLVDDLTDLVERARQGEAAAYDTLVDRYANRLFGYLYRMIGSRADAEDLLQDVFVRVVRTLPRYEHNGAFDAWLFRIATNLVRDRYRRAQRSPVTLSLHGPSENEDETGDNWTAVAEPTAPDENMHRAEAVDALQAALRQLPQAEREVVMLRHFSDLSFAEIATVMDTPLGTALARAHRGLAKLRRIMGASPEGEERQ